MIGKGVVPQRTVIQAYISRTSLRLLGLVVEEGSFGKILIWESLAGFTKV